MTPEQVLEKLEALQDILKESELKRTRLEGAMSEVKKEMKNLGFPTSKKLELEKTRLFKKRDKQMEELMKELANFSRDFGELLEEIN